MPPNDFNGETTRDLARRTQHRVSEVTHQHLALAVNEEQILAIGYAAFLAGVASFGGALAAMGIIDKQALEDPATLIPAVIKARDNLLANARGGSEGK